MRFHLLLATVALLGIGILMVTTSTPAAPAKSDGTPKTITGYGCVTAGVEAGCLMVTDKKTQTVYNVYFRGAKPRVGTAIRFTGTAHEGPTTCMQGQAVNVSSWIQLKMKCRPAS